VFHSSGSGSFFLSICQLDFTKSRYATKNLIVYQCIHRASPLARLFFQCLGTSDWTCVDTILPMQGLQVLFLLPMRIGFVMLAAGVYSLMAYV